MSKRIIEKTKVYAYESTILTDLDWPVYKNAMYTEWLKNGQLSWQKDIDISDVQLSDQWCVSCNDQSTKHWQVYTDSTDVSGNRWEDQLIMTWDNNYEVGTAAVKLATTMANMADVDIKYFGIQNLGEEDLRVSITSTRQYVIKVRPGNVFSMTVNSLPPDVKPHLDDIWVKAAANTTTYKFLLAK